jgi:NTP pyrophosphatase (non-canonical NTP hydrolase)
MKPEYEPKTTEQILGYLVEECGEVLAAVGKAQRWGLESVNPELRPGDDFYKETNREWILRELIDLEGAIARVKSELRRGRCSTAPEPAQNRTGAIEWPGA